MHNYIMITRGSIPKMTYMHFVKLHGGKHFPEGKLNDFFNNQIKFSQKLYDYEVDKHDLSVKLWKML